jgi:hypothetical protein
MIRNEFAPKPSRSHCQVQTSQSRALVDCGRFQDGRRSEALNRPTTGPRQKLEARLFTRAHQHGSASIQFITADKGRHNLLCHRAVLSLTLMPGDIARKQDY